MGPIFEVYKLQMVGLDSRFWDKSFSSSNTKQTMMMMRAVHSSLNRLFKFDSKIGRFLGLLNEEFCHFMGKNIDESLEHV